MFCVKCGKQLSEEDAFCAACGTPVVGTQSPATPAEPVTAVEPAAPVEPVTPVEPAKPAEPVEPWEKPEASNHEGDLPARRTRKPKRAKAIKVKFRKERPPMVLRALAQMFCFFLCLMLVVALLASVMVLDLRRLTSTEGLETLIHAVFSGAGVGSSQNAPAQIPAAPQASADFAVVALSGYDIDVDDIPQDILAGGNSQENMDSLVDWIYEALREGMGEELPFTEEDLQEFVNESNVSDYVSEKLAGFAEDFIQGTENTTITSEELMQLLEDNEHLLEEKLNFTLTEETRQDIHNNLTELVDEQDLSGTIRDSVNEAMDEALQESMGVDLATAQEAIRQITSDKTLWSLLGICLALIALLCGLNYYNLGAGFTWSSAAGILVGWLVCLPLMTMDLIWEAMVEAEPEMAEMVGSLDAFVAPIAPIHYGLFYGSLVVFVLSIVWRIVARMVNSSRPYA